MPCFCDGRLSRMKNYLRLFWTISANAAAAFASGLPWKQLRIWPPFPKNLPSGLTRIRMQFGARKLLEERCRDSSPGNRKCPVPLDHNRWDVMSAGLVTDSRPWDRLPAGSSDRFRSSVLTYLSTVTLANPSDGLCPIICSRFESRRSFPGDSKTARIADATNFGPV